MMQTDARVFIQGRVSAEDDKPSKLICEKIFPFAGIPKELWIQFPDKETYEREVADLYQMLHESDGKDSVILYIKSIKAMKKTAAEPQCAGRCPSGGVTSGKIRYRKRESCRKEY